MASLLFPDPPRDFPRRRGLKIVLRAVHVLCVALLTGAHVLQVEGAQSDWYWATVGSGALLLALDLHESAAFLLQVRGLFLLFKIGTLISLPAFGDQAGYVLSGLLLLSVISSHAPSKVRYHMFWGEDRIRASKSKG